MSTILPKKLYFDTLLSAVKESAETAGFHGFDFKLETSFEEYYKNEDTIADDVTLMAMVDMPSPYLMSASVSAKELENPTPLLQADIEMEWGEGAEAETFSGTADIFPVGYTSYSKDVVSEDVISEKHFVYKLTDNGRVWFPVHIIMGGGK